jgi:iron complex transport system substrate-binding protein
VTARFTVDDLARPMVLDRGVRRIVSLAPACTECLVALGARDRLVGVEEHSDISGLGQIPRVGGFKHVDLEAVVALAPDLVVAASLHALTSAPALAARGVPVFVMRPHTLDTLVHGMARLAAVIGSAPANAEYLGRCRARIAAVVEQTLRRRVRPLVYLELSPDGYTGGPQSFVDDLITKAGGVNLGGRARVEWPRLDASTVLRFDPDVIVIAAWPGSTTPTDLGTREGWDRLTAVKSGRVWAIPAGLVKRPGPGLIDGLEQLATLFTAFD